MKNTKNTPSLFNDKGLKNGVDFIFKSENEIDWIQMINQSFIVPNSSFFEKRGIPVPKTIEGLNEKEKLVTLGGYKELASLRGFKSVRFIPLGYCEKEISLSCEILWRGNFETDFEDVLYSSTANASYNNVSDINFKKFLTPLAENRAFVRNVRNFLKIPILGQDELSKEDNLENSSSNESVSNFEINSPHWVLEKLLKDKNKNFETLIQAIVKKEIFSEQETCKWKALGDISVGDVIKILKIFNYK